MEGESWFGYMNRIYDGVMLPCIFFVLGCSTAQLKLTLIRTMPLRVIVGFVWLIPYCYSSDLDLYYSACLIEINWFVIALYSSENRNQRLTHHMTKQQCMLLLSVIVLYYCSYKYADSGVQVEDTATWEQTKVHGDELDSVGAFEIRDTLEKTQKMDEEHFSLVSNKPIRMEVTEEATEWDLLMVVVQIVLWVPRLMCRCFAKLLYKVPLAFWFSWTNTTMRFKRVLFSQSPVKVTVVVGGSFALLYYKAFGYFLSVLLVESAWFAVALTIETTYAIEEKDRIGDLTIFFMSLWMLMTIILSFPEYASQPSGLIINHFIVFTNLLLDGRR